MTGLEIIGIIGLIGYAGEQVLAALPIPENSSLQVFKRILKKIARLKG